MFEPYSNKNGDEYTTGQPVSRDKIKNRIDFQILKNYVPRGADIQSDIYQNLFINLLTINEKNTKKLVDEYYQNPNSAYHFAFYLLRIKAFGVDKKYPNKPSSDGKKMMYASSFNIFNSEVSYLTDEDVVEDEDGETITNDAEYFNDG